MDIHRLCIINKESLVTLISEVLLRIGATNVITPFQFLEKILVV